MIPKISACPLWTQVASPFHAPSPAGNGRKTAPSLFLLLKSFREALPKTSTILKCICYAQRPHEEIICKFKKGILNEKKHFGFRVSSRAGRSVGCDSRHDYRGPERVRYD